MERELLLTGIGGQGVQLAAQVIARAATIEGRHVLLFGVYSGMMRGGNTDATVVVGDEPLHAPPLVSHTWSAIAMHDEFWEPLARKLRPRALVLVNEATFAAPIDTEAYRVVSVPATDLARELGSELTASMVMTGAYVGITGLVSLESAVEAMRESVPSYRRQHVERNEVAIQTGYEHVERLAAPAWAEVAV